MQRGRFVWWRNGPDIQMGRVRDVDLAGRKVFIAPTCGGFAMWFPIGTPGLNLLQELDMDIPMPRRNDYA